ncbi:prepilin-type N-terminal cleavage/methylation domain-containing protein [Terrilactibacillus sp. BCM23-1]|uniref:Prepilin-type N-terminal cleavage/methylation domain-containing protein n=1 Tax=Terrilactibacillus tamarindi TaxID=2599694 RepID=A0A6N8CNN7_9BACI|nr:type II secretion system protein [Terrilactibacillus tamarindi]MTT31749.1 prepilin-type N-terminal cleavage/methylation domain-containing protein [Terrilactibacillus tamarindi]
MLKKFMNKKNQKGFTLVELLAVIVILAVIAAIAVPSITSIIKKSNDKAAVQDALTIIHAAKLYVGEHNITSTTTLSKTELSPYVEKSSDISKNENYSVAVHISDTDANYIIKGITLNGPKRSTGGYEESELIKYNKGN